MIRPQQKRVKDHKAMVESLKRGDEVITSGGIIGVVDRVMEDDRIKVVIVGTKVQIINQQLQVYLKEKLKNNSFRVKFSKINMLIIYLVFFIFSIFSILNFQDKNNIILDKVNLGLDLQGGSYLLLEINSDTLIKEKIQSKVILLKKLLRENNLSFKDFKINKNSLVFFINDLEKFEILFFSKKEFCKSLY